MAINRIIAFGSAKGGVGKSSITASIAITLSNNYKVGILDADIHCPNQHLLFDINDIPNFKDKKNIKPIVKNKINIMSMGFILDNTTSALWRGPLLSRAIKELINKTTWGDLDYLLIDMPPGTGDAYLTIFNELDIDNFILISTRNDLAISDSKRTISMLNKLNINILGYIENDIFNLNDHENTKLFKNIKNLGTIRFNKKINNFDHDYNNPDTLKVIKAIEKHI